MSPPALLSFCPHPAAPSVPNKFSQFTPVLIFKGHGEGSWGKPVRGAVIGGGRTGPGMQQEWGHRVQVEEGG